MRELRCFMESILLCRINLDRIGISRHALQARLPLRMSPVLVTECLQELFKTFCRRGGRSQPIKPLHVVNRFQQRL